MGVKWEQLTADGCEQPATYGCEQPTADGCEQPTADGCERLHTGRLVAVEQPTAVLQPRVEKVDEEDAENLRRV